MSDELDDFVVAEDEEDLAFLLTLVAKKLNPKINSGKVYEIYLTMLVELLNGHTMTEEDGLLIGQRILDTVGVRDKKDEIH